MVPRMHFVWNVLLGSSLSSKRHETAIHQDNLRKLLVNSLALFGSIVSYSQDFALPTTREKAFLWLTPVIASNYWPDEHLAFGRDGPKSRKEKWAFENNLPFKFQKVSAKAKLWLIKDNINK